jgi:hypothetical protein
MRYVSLVTLLSVLAACHSDKDAKPAAADSNQHHIDAGSVPDAGKSAARGAAADSPPGLERPGKLTRPPTGRLPDDLRPPR